MAWLLYVGSTDDSAPLTVGTKPNADLPVSLSPVFPSFYGYRALELLKHKVQVARDTYIQLAKVEDIVEFVTALYSKEVSLPSVSAILDWLRQLDPTRLYSVVITEFDTGF